MRDGLITKASETTRRLGNTTVNPQTVKR